MKLFFVRHGEQGGEHSALTEYGKDEMREVGENLGFNETVIVFYPPGTRFAESAEILLGNMNSPYKKREVRNLSYRKINQKTPYYEGLIDSIRARKCLEYHIHHSDNHIKESGEEISSYTTMAAHTSRLLLKYIDIQNRLPEERMVDIQRIFCAREFIWSCFRAKLIELKYGREAMLEYVDWYSQTQEGNPDARKSIASISANASRNSYNVIHISDAYGEDEISIADLEYLIEQERELLESSIKS
jgi:hypothetical protein